MIASHVFTTKEIIKEIKSAKKLNIIVQKRKFMMSVFEYLTGRGGMLILGLFVVVVLLYNKIKARNEFKRPTKKKDKL